MSGTVAIVFGILAVALFASAGLAIEFGNAVRLQSRLQTALDAAVLTGVRADPDGRQAIATQAFAEHLKSESPPAISLSFTNPSAEQLAGTASTRLSVTLLRLIGFDDLGIATHAIATAKANAKVCALVLDPSASQALLVNGGAQVLAPDCEIHVRSTASNAAVFNAGTTIDSKRLCIASSSVLDNGGSHPNMEKSCTPAGDPYVGRFAQPSSNVCTFNNLNFNGGVVTLNPGVYCGGINFNSQPNVTLNPGVYVIKSGDWNVGGGTWTGNGVTFYFADTSRLQFNSAVASNLTAPTSGPYKDVVMLEKEGLARSPFVLDDSHGMSLTGLVYLPSRDTIFNGGTALRSKDLTLVVNTLILNQTNWDFTSTTTEIGSGSTSAPRLVE